jgi:hypothetical protein
MTTTINEALGMSGAVAPAQRTVALKRRSIDSVLVGLGAAVVAVLIAAGGLLTWGSNFSNDYVHKELTAQHIFFPDRAALEKEGRLDLASYAGAQVGNGNQAKAYASYIAGHLETTGGGLTYADLGKPETAAKAAVTAATAAQAPADQVSALQAKADGITNQRNTMFKGETLRGLLLSTFAWTTLGRIAGIAAIVSFLAAAVMVVLVALGMRHHHKLMSTPAQ